VVSVALLLAGIAMIAVSFFGRSKEETACFSKTGSLRALASMLLLIAYALIFPSLGFVVTSGVFLAVFSYLFGARNPLKIGGAAVAAPVATWLLFEMFFRVPLPHGVLF
jgi:putative tricarboxylic transport membrane protein